MNVPMLMGGPESAVEVMVNGQEQMGRSIMRVAAATFICLFAQLLVQAQNTASSNSPRTTVSFYLKALRALDHDQMQKYWAENVVLRNKDGTERPLNRQTMRKMRDFERNTKTSWRYKIKRVVGEQVTVELVEENDFYKLLGVGKRTQIEVYYVRGGRIYQAETKRLEQEHGDYKVTVERFTVWLSKTAAANDSRIIQGGHLIFDGESAKRLRPWLERWSIQQKSKIE